MVCSCSGLSRIVISRLAFHCLNSRRRAGLSEGNGAVPVDLCLKALLAHRLLDDIHLAAQNAGQTPFEFAQAAEIVETWRREILAEAYCHIDLVCRLLLEKKRAENVRNKKDTDAIDRECTHSF